MILFVEETSMGLMNWARPSKDDPSGARHVFQASAISQKRLKTVTTKAGSPSCFEVMTMNHINSIVFLSQRSS